MSESINKPERSKQGNHRVRHTKASGWFSTDPVAQMWERVTFLALGGVPCSCLGVRVRQPLPKSAHRSAVSRSRCPMSSTQGEANS